MASKFEGRPDVTLTPDFYPQYTTPIHVTRANARRIIEKFDKTGRYVWGPTGNTLWVIMEHAAEKGIPYRLTYHRERGKLPLTGLTAERIEV